MIIKLRQDTRGGRRLVSLYIGPDVDHLQNAGHLVLSVDEYDLFVAALRVGAAFSAFRDRLEIAEEIR